MFRFERKSLIQVVFVSTFLAPILLPTTIVDAHICWFYTGLNATNPQPWHISNPESGCSTTNYLHSIGDLNQLIGEQHRNWHCINDEAATEAYGRAFLAFHRQFILDFDIWRLANTPYGRLEIWDPFQNAPVPGDDENTAIGFNNCSDANIPNPGDNLRSAGAICTGCQNLPTTYIGNNLNTFNSLGEVGYNLEFDWHGSFHNGVAALGCEDIGGFIYTSRDPAFWMAHKKLDEVARDWQSLQATDVVIVIDRSGSMDDNCPGGDANPGESPCAINDAREAALTFANAVLDVRLDGGAPAAQQHRIGLVSFASGGTSELGLTPANGIVTDNGVDDTSFEDALAALSAGGSTSIAAGIREAISILNSVPDPNPHQAVLVLTDGKENTAPCLGGNSPSDCSSADVLTVGEVGDIQIVAVGFGDGAEEANLRDVAERHGGVFFAEEDVSATLDLQKFFISAFAEIYDAAVSLDPKGTLQTGQLASEPFEIEISDDDRLSVVLGSQATELKRRCDLALELFTPSGKLVNRSDPGIEAGHGEKHDFIHVNLPYLGESTGAWTGRVVRLDSSRECGPQNYFYSVLVKGFGRIDPFVVRPNVVVGRQILSTFRITESNRPIGGFDSVAASVTLTRANDQIEVHRLYDDGTHGDMLAGNHIWSVEIPEPAHEPGAYHLRGHFELTNNGRTRVRESEYSIVVQPAPEQCTNVVAGGIVNAFLRHRVQPGDTLQLAEVVYLWNMCASPDQYELQVSDNMGWLKTLDPVDTGQLIDLPASFESGLVAAFEGQSFGRGPEQGNPGGGIPIIAVIPQASGPGEYSVISIRVSSLVHPDQKPIDVSTKIEIAPPPDCNGNGVDDAVDIANGTSDDNDGNGVPDECEGDPHYQPPDTQPPVSPIKWLLVVVLMLTIILVLAWIYKRHRDPTSSA